MTRNRWVQSLLIAGLLLLVSCADADPPTAPTSTNGVAFSSAGLDARKAEHDSLKAVLRQVKDSLKDLREAHREEFRQARDEWKLFKKDLKKLGTLPTLLSCEPQEFAAEAELIGPEGGSIHLGAHELVIPRGALDREIIISGTAPVSNIVEVDLQPEGLQFATPAELKLDYSHCVQPPAWAQVVVVYLGDNEQILNVQVSRDKKGIKEVDADLNHFSRYAVAW